MASGEPSRHTTDSDGENLSCLVICSRRQKLCLDTIRARTRWLSLGVGGLCVALAGIYLVLALRRSIEDSIALLVVAVVTIVILVIYLVIFIRGEDIVRWYDDRVEEKLTRFWRYGRWVTYGAITVSLVVFIGVDIGENDPYNLVSISGIAFFLIAATLYSKSPANIPWRTVFCGVVAQLAIGIIVLRWPPGKVGIEWMADRITHFLSYGQAGAKFVFGERNEEHFWAMALMPILCWFTAVVNVLLYLGVLQYVTRILGYILFFFVGTSPVEALVATADIFLGPESSILMIRSMVPHLTVSQLHALITCGLASIDAGLLPFFVSFGIPARHLLSASAMSAPAALVISKMVFPEPEHPKDGDDNPDTGHRSKQKCPPNTRHSIQMDKPDAVNVLHAFSEGAMHSIPIITSIMTQLVAVLGLLEFVNTTLTWFGHRAGVEQLTLQLILSYPLMPVAFLMGVSWPDCGHVASLMGTKTIVNELVAYTELAQLISNREHGVAPYISPRSETIAAYALCGFSNIGTVGMMIAFMATIVPDKIGDIASCATRSLVAASMACFMTGCVAGVLYQE